MDLKKKHDKNESIFQEVITILNDHPSQISESTIKDYKINRRYLRLENLSGMIYTTHISSSDPKKVPIACCLILHGLYETSSNYLEMALQLVNEKIQCFLIDLRGFGFSTGYRSVADLIFLQSDIITLLNSVKLGCPFFVYAHSISASIIMGLLINNPALKISGLILSCPQLGSNREQKTFLHKLIDKFSGFYLRSCSIDPSELTTDPPLVLSMCKQMARIERIHLINDYNDTLIDNAKFITLPIIIFQGDCDTIASLIYTEEFFSRVNSQNKELKVFRGCGHALHLESKRYELFKDCAQFIHSISQRSDTFLTIPAKINYSCLFAYTSWPKRITILLAIFLYLLVGIIYRKGTGQSLNPIWTTLWPFHLLKYIFFH